MNHKRLFILEGNIGAGKSTLLKILKNNIDFEAIPEPTTKWQKINNDDNLLDLFYKDTKRWAYTFQSYAFISRIQATIEHQQNNPDKQNFVLERSVYCDRFCFAKNCFERGTMTELEWQIYKDWFSWLAESQIPQPTGFIYLRAEPEICMQRLQKRNRSEETGIAFEYLSSLHKKHEDWLIKKIDLPKALLNIPVLVLDCNQEFEQNKQQEALLIEKIRAFMQNQAFEPAHKESNLIQGQI